MSEPDSFGTIVKNGTIKVCYVPWSPSILKDPNTAKLSGFAIDMMDSIARDADLKPEYVETTWGGFAADLAAKKCDMGLDFYPLLNRAKTIAFSKPFYYVGNNMLVKSDSKYADLESLNDPSVKIAVIQGEFGHLYAQKNLPKAQLVVLDASSDNTAPLLTVVAGQADAGMIMDDTIAAFIRNNTGLKKLSETPYSTTPNSFGVRMNDKNLLQFLNTAVDMMEAKGEFASLAKKYDSGWFVKKTEYVPLHQ